MAINKLSSSRYTTTTRDVDGYSRSEAIRKSTVKSNTISHVCSDGESFSSLAGRFYGDATLFWKIADFNPSIKFPDFIPIGTVVKIPMS